MRSELERVRVQALNDQFRTTFAGGRVLLTRGVAALPANRLAQVLRQVREFAAFGPENDPYGEHDFGSIEQEGDRLFWKIDYYDTLLVGASSDPSNPAVTARVLTLMLADEY